MKKNMLAVVILAVSLINLTLSAMLIFTIVPKAKRTDSLIEKIVSAVDLETEAGLGKSYGEVLPEDQEDISLFKDELVNLKTEAGGTGYGQVSVTLTLNKKHEDYSKVQPLIAAKTDKIKSTVQIILKDYTVGTVVENAEEINARMLTAVKDIFQSSCIIEVTVNTVAVQ